MPVVQGGDMRPEAIAIRLSNIRRAFEMEKSEIADRAGISRTSWSRFEQGQRAIPFNDAAKLVRHFGVTLDYIYLGSYNGLSYEVATRLRDQEDLSPPLD